MSSTKASRAERRPLAARLASARDQRFVGRRVELELFLSAIEARRSPFVVLQIGGPAGVGKTTLLQELARIAIERGRTVIALDGRDVVKSRRGFLAALDRALGGDGENPRASRVPAASVLLVDTYEALSGLDRWLRSTVLPELPDDVVVVLAGRGLPSVDWRTDVAWSPLTRFVELESFGSSESIAFLESRGVATAAHSRILGFTRGHPLALALSADLVARSSEGSAFDPTKAPDMVQHLLSQLVESSPLGPCREALEICAVARFTSEPLLVELLGKEEGREAFRWLRDQSFVECGPLGVAPHDLVREALLADARWRDPAGLRRRAGSIYAALHARLRAAGGAQRQRLQLEALYVTRVRPTNEGFFDWGAVDDVQVDAAGPGDADWVLGLVRRHEGPDSAELARHWWQIQPEAFQLLRDANGGRFGFCALLEIAAGSEPPAPRDPAVVAALEFADRHGPVQRGDVLLYLRWWMHAESYQAVTAAINLTSMHVVSQCTTRADVAWNFVAMADPAFWAPHFEGVNFGRAAEADFEVDGRRHGVFAHDWRFEPAADWISGVRVPMPFSARADGSPSGAPLPSEAELASEVRRALRAYARPGALDESTLRFARTLHATLDAEDPSAAVRNLLREAAEALRTDPRDDRLYRALWHTYFEPLATQERVAERLGLPFSTYRRHLGRAIRRIGGWLWQRERAARRVR